MGNTKYQKLLRCIEEKNKKDIDENKINNESLYPHLNDKKFMSKISVKKEFNDLKIEEKKREDIDNIETVSTDLCNPNIDFELSSHQMFVRNFLSSETPYNGLLLFHGLGTGKTCSSISVCEDMRTYNKQIGNKKKIIIVASPVVQENYKLQLFDRRRLKLINGLWNINSCTGNKFINEINPMGVDMTRRQVEYIIDKIIKESYSFMGYTKFANRINNIIQRAVGNTKDKEKINKRKSIAIKKAFSDRLLVIDEVHNIRATKISGNKDIRRTTQNMLDLVTYSDNMKILLLTATPMFNSATEIIWLLNLLNLNDNRFPININEIFDSNLNFLENPDDRNIGKNLLIQKSIGYVSYVSGENPFSFPYKIWPSYYKNKNSLKFLLENDWKYPKTQINGAEIPPVSIQYLDLIITELSQEQDMGYNFVVEKEKEKYPILNNKASGIQYTVIDGLQQSLNIIYPVTEGEKERGIEAKALYGKTGLGRVFLYDIDKKQKNFRYTDNILTNYGRILSSKDNNNSPLRKYSSKIYSIIDTIKNSKGIILIYSNYIYGGCIPVALALEEIGIRRFGDDQKSLFSNPPVDNYKIYGTDINAKYVMITGDPNLSGVSSNKEELRACTNPLNVSGEKVKVIIISKAGTEGLDFKNIRQVHILEPWFNLNRIDQTVGRGVRNKSHCDLPFEERTVQVFLYGSQLKNPTIEPIDLYVYRLAEYKSIKIGKVSKILKENSVDCIINSNQKQLLKDKLNKKVKLLLSTGQNITFDIGHRNDSFTCDFMNCDYKCNPDEFIDGSSITKSTYSKNYIIMNLNKILKRIKNLYKEHYIYKKTELIKRIKIIKNYSDEQIYMAIDILLNGKEHMLTDMLNRKGILINIGEYYLFQPINITDKHITSYERRHPTDFRHKSIIINAGKFQEESKENKIQENHFEKLKEEYNRAIKTSQIKNHNWIDNAGMVINNLVKYNDLSRNILNIFCLEYLFDIKNINEKLNIINNLEKIKNTTPIENFTAKLKKIVDNKYIIDGLLVLSDYKNQFDSPPGEEWQNVIKIYNIEGAVFFKLNPENNKWENYIGNDGLGKIFKKFRFNKEGTLGIIDVDNINNNIIGFLTQKNSKNDKVIFKIKGFQKGSLKRGLACDTKGTQKQSRIDKINKLIFEGVTHTHTKKYAMNGNGIQILWRRLKISSTKRMKKITKESADTINHIQLCIELEFLLRYLDKEKHLNKKYFFSTIEDIFNGRIRNLMNK